MKYSTGWRPSIGTCRLFWPLQRAEMAVLNHLFWAKCILYIRDKARKKIDLGFEVFRGVQGIDPKSEWPQWPDTANKNWIFHKKIGGESVKFALPALPCGTNLVISLKLWPVIAWILYKYIITLYIVHKNALLTQFWWFTQFVAAIYIQFFFAFGMYGTGGFDSLLHFRLTLLRFRLCLILCKRNDLAPHKVV